MNGNGSRSQPGIILRVHCAFVAHAEGSESRLILLFYKASIIIMTMVISILHRSSSQIVQPLLWALSCVCSVSQKKVYFQKNDYHSK